MLSILVQAQTFSHRQREAGTKIDAEKTLRKKRAGKGKTRMALSDVELMQRFIEGDEEAFATIVHRYECLLLGIARQMLFDHDLAQDACQYTWLKLFLHKPRGEVSLKNWLITVVFHRCLDEKRRKKRTPFLFSSFECDGEELDLSSICFLIPALHQNNWLKTTNSRRSYR